MLRQRSNPLALATSSDGGLLRGFDGGSEAVVKMFSIRVVLGLAAALYLEIEQLDVKTAFLAHHGDLEEDIYIWSNLKDLRSQTRRTWCGLFFSNVLPQDNGTRNSFMADTSRKP